MKLIDFLEQEKLVHEQLDRFFRRGGRRYRDKDIDVAKDWFPDFKKELACHTNEHLYGDDRLALFREVQDLASFLSRYARKKSLGYELSYKLNQSFLSDDEVNLIILKQLHRPISQEKLAEKIGCSRNAIKPRIDALKDGWRLGDMSVRIAPEYGGRLQSTVHPILLPLNLSEVYVLLGTLLKSVQGKSDKDPRVVIARDLAEKIYFQLSDYARERIDPRLEELGAHLDRDTQPSYRVDESGVRRDGTRPNRLQLSYRWTRWAKEGTRVKITLADGTEEQTLLGRLMLFDGDVVSRLAEGSDRNPAYCFVLKQDDGSHVALSWGDVLDIEAADAAPPAHPGRRRR